MKINRIENVFWNNNLHRRTKVVEKRENAKRMAETENRKKGAKKYRDVGAIFGAIDLRV